MGYGSIHVNRGKVGCNYVNINQITRYFLIKIAFLKKKAEKIVTSI